MVITIVVALVVSALAFFGGMQYQKSQRGSFAGRFGGQGGFARTGDAQGTRPVSGSILSQDANSITVKMPDGSTKIVILSDKTAINKASAGAKSDLTTGAKVAVFGTQNSDGSITAQVISLGGNMFRGMRNQASPSEQPITGK